MSLLPLSDAAAALVVVLVAVSSAALIAAVRTINILKNEFLDAITIRINAVFDGFADYETMKRIRGEEE